MFSYTISNAAIWLATLLAIYLTNRFHFAVVCSVINAQMTSQRGKNKNVAHETKSSVSLMFLPRCDVLCASITEQTTTKWNLFVLYNKYMKKYSPKDLLNFPWEIFGSLKMTNRVSWRDPWSVQIKQRHWLVILQWDPWLVYINQTTSVT